MVRHHQDDDDQRNETERLANIELYRERWEQGLDLYTGEPLGPAGVAQRDLTEVLSRSRQRRQRGR